MTLKPEPLKTDLIGGKTLKTDEKVEFFGQVDELSAHIMEVTHYIDDVQTEMELRKIVNLLSTMMGEVAGGFGHIGEKHLSELLEVIAKYEELAGPFKGFVDDAYGRALSYSEDDNEKSGKSLCPRIRKIRRQRIYFRIS